MTVNITSAEKLMDALEKMLLFGGIFRYFRAYMRLTFMIGRKKAHVFFLKIPYVRALLQTDLQAAYDGDPAAQSLREIQTCYPGFFAVMVHRVAYELYQLEIPLLPRMLAELAHGRTGIDIHPGADIGSYFFIDHGTGVVIGQTAVVGSHVKLYQGVTLGALSTKDGRRLQHSKRHPTVGDDVTIYANATILGGDTQIGSGSTIGANAFVTASVPPGSKITGNG